mgnify:CR=1 FL=1
MALDPRDIAELLKLRALGFSQAEIAEKLKTSQQVIAYQLRKLKEQANKKGTDEVFNAALIGKDNSLALGVGLIPLGPLTNKSSLTKYLNLLRALLIAGCVIPIFLLALVTFFSSKRALKTTKRLRSKFLIFML